MSADGSEGPCWCASPSSGTSLPLQPLASLELSLLLLAFGEPEGQARPLMLVDRNAGSSGKVS